MTKASDDPRCKHRESSRRVTSLPDEVKWEPGMPMRSVWVCEDRACVLDAMAWVERGTGLPAIIYDNSRTRVEL